MNSCYTCGKPIGKENRCIYCNPTKSEAESLTLGEHRK